MKCAHKQFFPVGGKGHLNRKSFQNDLQNVVRVLERFGETVTLKKEGNLLSIKGDGKAVEVELVNENFLQTDTNEPNLTFTDVFEITSTINGIKNQQISSTAISSNTIQFMQEQFKLFIEHINVERYEITLDRLKVEDSISAAMFELYLSQSE
jgi:hypothetical protein